MEQIELVTAAKLSGEPSLIEAFNSGIDMHTDRAILLWSRETLEDRYPELRGHPPSLWKRLSPRFAALERHVGKTVNFADLFAAEAATMQASVFRDTGEIIPLSIFENAVRSRPVARPVLHAWQQSLIRTATSEGCIRLPFFGQSRTFDMPADTSEVLNYPIQTTAANVTLLLQISLSRLFATMRPPPLLCLNGYDSLLIDCQSHAIAVSVVSAARSLLSSISSSYWNHLSPHPVPLRFSYTVTRSPSRGRSA